MSSNNMKNRNIRRTEKTDNRMFQKLAKNNVKMNARNYMVYFLTLMFSVAMLYTFNSIGAQFGMLNLKDEGSYLSFSMGMMAGVSVLISIIMGFLVIYANRFLMRRRKKELGIYITLGMPQKELSKLLYRETLIIGSVSLAAGILLGIVLSQGLALITIRFLQLEGAAYRFVFSPLAILECIVFYTLMFAFINFYNKRTIKKSTLLQLLHAEQLNENASEQGVIKNLTGLILAALCFGIAYTVSMMDGFNIKYISVGVVFVFIGTFLFFRAIASIILYWTHRKKRLYYKDLNMFAVHQVSSKMNSTNTTLSVICLLLFLSFTTLAVGLGLSMEVIGGFDKMTSSDAVVVSYPKRDGENTGDRTLEEWLEEKGIPLKKLASNTTEVNLYEQDAVLLEDFLSENASGSKQLKKNKNLEWKAPLSMMKVSDFNKIRTQQGLKPVTLSENQFLLNYNVIQMEKLYESYGKQKAPVIDIKGTKLSLKEKGIFKMAYRNANILADIGTLIVPDYVAEGSTIENTILNCNLNPDIPDAGDTLGDAFFDHGSENLDFVLKSAIVTEITSTNMTLSYIAVYLGLIFLICACAVLALQQISSTADSSRHYETLRRLGAPNSHIVKSLLTQIAIYFGAPLAVGLVHSAAAVTVMYKGMTSVTAGQVAWNILFATVLLLTVYGSYFFVTYINSRNTIRSYE